MGRPGPVERPRRSHRAAARLLAVLVGLLLLSTSVAIGGRPGPSAPPHPELAAIQTAESRAAASSDHGPALAREFVVPTDRSLGALSAPPKTMIGGSVGLAGSGGHDGPASRFSKDPLLQASELPSRLLSAGSAPSFGAIPRGSASGSTGANFYVNGSECSFDERATQLGGSPDGLATLLFSSYSLYNGSVSGSPCVRSRLAISPFFFSHGALEVARSTNSGRNWTDSWPNTATSWWGNGTLNNSVFGGFGGIASDHGSSVDTSTVLVAGDYGGACLVLANLVGPAVQPGCTDEILNHTSTGVAVDRSVDGARSWGNATELMRSPAFVYTSSLCGAGFYQGNITQEPSLAMNPVNHHALLTWDVYQQGYNTTNCTYVKLKVTAFRSVSADGGVTWSPPAVIGGRTNGSVPVAAIGPAPTYAMSVVLNDDTNGSVATKNTEATHSLLFVESKDNGSSWSPPAIIPGNKVGNTSGSASNTALEFPEYPTIAYDNWSNSAFRGNLYVAYGNNETGGANIGNPGISITIRTSGTPGWSAPTVLVDPDHAMTLWDPAIAVGSGGAVWITFVGVGIFTGLYREYAIVSEDGGANWSPIFAVDDIASIPGYVAGISVSSLLFNFGLVGTSNGTYAGWTDCRQSNCTSTFDLQVYVAQLFPANLTTNAPHVSLGLTTFGLRTNLSLSSSSTLYYGWPSGSTHALLAPLDVPSNQSGQIEGFLGFSGIVASNNSSVAFVSSSGGTIRVNYQSAAPAYLTGTLAPNVPQARLYLTVPGGMRYQVPLTGLNASTQQFNYTVPGGDYLYSASAGFRYTTDLNHSFHATSGQATTVHLTLTKTYGWISGSVILAPGATQATTIVTINESSVPLDPSGGFSESVPWGYYWVNASNPKTISYAPTTPIVVTPNAYTRLSLSLIGGWIEGLIYATPGPVQNLTVTVNGSTSGVRIVGATYNWSGPSGQTAARGWYWVNATEPGYNTTSQYVYVRPASATLRNLYISNHAEVTGVIQPLGVVQNIRSDSLSVRFENRTDGLVYYVSSYVQSTGGFNLTVRGGDAYEVTVSAKGYERLIFELPSVPAGNSSPPVQISLLAVAANCTAAHPCLTPTPSQGPIVPTWLEAGGVIAALGIAAAGLLWRRRTGPPTPLDESTPTPAEE